MRIHGHFLHDGARDGLQPFPGWPAIPTGEQMLNELSGWTSTGDASASLVAPGGGGVNLAHGGVLGPDGKIYTIPNGQVNRATFDPETNTRVNSSLASASTRWYGGVLGPNGLIYGTPFDQTVIIVIDPSDDSHTLTSMGADLTGTNKWRGGVLAADGKIYCAPQSAGDILVIDPVGGTAIRTKMGLATTPNSYFGCVLGVDGKIYGVPASATQILIIDPVAGTAALSDMGADLTGTTKWCGGVLGPDGKIYGVPARSSDILVIDPMSGTAIRTDMGLGDDLPATTTNKYEGGALGSDGRIYCVPRLNIADREILIIDPATGSATKSSLGISSWPSFTGWTGAVNVGDRIYGIPNNNGSTNAQLLIINTPGTGGGMDAILSPYLNKF